MLRPPGPTAVAVKVTGLPPSPAFVAVKVFGPARVPSVHWPALAMPFAPVACDGLTTLPPPPVTAKFTVTPAMGLANRSVTNTAGEIGTADPTVAV